MSIQQPCPKIQWALNAGHTFGLMLSTKTVFPSWQSHKTHLARLSCSCQPRCKQGSITKPLRWLRFDKNVQEWYLESYTYFANGDHQSISDVCWTTRILPKLLQSLDWNNFSGSAKTSWFIYTTWKVDGATLMYWFIMDPYKSPPFGSCATHGHSSKPALPLAHGCCHRPCCNASLYSGHLPERTSKGSIEFHELKKKRITFQWFRLSIRMRASICFFRFSMGGDVPPTFFGR